MVNIKESFNTECPKCGKKDDRVPEQAPTPKNVTTILLCAGCSKDPKPVENNPSV